MWSALVTYVVMSVTAWALPQDRATVLLTFLAALFAAYGVLSGVALEVTRAVAAAARDDHAPGPKLWRIAAVVSASSAVAVLVLAPFWSERVLHSSDPALLPALVVAVGGYGVHCVLVGGASGRAWWREAALVITGEATLRLLMTVVVVAVAASVTSIGVASAAGAFAWVAVVVLSPRARSALHLRADVPAVSLARRIGASLVAQGASAVLVVGFPILLAATTARAEYAAAAPLLLAISLTRAPVLLPLNALQGVAVSHLVRAGARMAPLLVRLLALVVGVAALGAVAAWAVGPWLMQALFGDDYAVDGAVLAVLTLAAGGTAALTLTGACAQALAAHTWYVAGWVVAVITCVGLLQVDGSMQWRACLALGVSPLVGLVVHAAGLARVRAAARTARVEVADV